MYNVWTPAQDAIYGEVTVEMKLGTTYTGYGLMHSGTLACKKHTDFL